MLGSLKLIQIVSENKIMVVGGHEKIKGKIRRYQE